jgi:hypothetical protein
MHFVGLVSRISYRHARNEQTKVYAILSTTKTHVDWPEKKPGIHINKLITYLLINSRQAFHVTTKI